MLPFTCGEKKICLSIKMSQNMNMVVANCQGSSYLIQAADM